MTPSVRIRTNWRLVAVGLCVCSVATPVFANVVLELVGSGEYTVGQAFPNSPEDVFPIWGDNVVIWGTLTNTGQDVFEATGPGGMQGSGTGTVGLWHSNYPLVHLWDPDADPDDGLIETPLGYWGVQLDPGESLTIAMIEIWGLSTTDYQPAPIGSYSVLYNQVMGFWAGLDRDPNDPLDSLDLFIPLDRSYTVTVVPEPTAAVLLAAMTGAIGWRRLRR